VLVDHASQARTCDMTMRKRQTNKAVFVYRFVEVPETNLPFRRKICLATSL
jgi:hypothetical protein